MGSGCKIGGSCDEWSKVEGGLSNKEAAIFHAKEALKLATCDGPPHYYKVAYEEAERMLKRLKDEG